MITAYTHLLLHVLEVVLQVIQLGSVCIARNLREQQPYVSHRDAETIAATAKAQTTPTTTTTITIAITINTTMTPSMMRPPP